MSVIIVAVLAGLMLGLVLGAWWALRIPNVREGGIQETPPSDPPSRANLRRIP